MRRLAALLPVAVAAALMAPVAPVAAAGGDIHCAGEVSIATCATTSGTIQEAVDLASPGDAVLIGPGVYRETVLVGTNDLVIRGVDRNAVELDGENAKQYGFQISGQNVEVSNLTTHNYTHTGVFWVGTFDYHARYVTAYNNRGYGIYALGSTRGLLEDSYASGNADSGFYIGECNPCEAVIRNVDSVFNALGYSGTNASNSLIIENSRWIDNGAGILPNTLDSEKFPPQGAIVIRNNIVLGSGNTQAPAEGIAGAALGMGIGVSGGSMNAIHDNTIDNCAPGSTDCESRYGIAIFPFPEPTPNVYIPMGNRVYDNQISNSGLFDLALAAPAGPHNCFSRNARPGGAAASSEPAELQTTHACEIEGTPLRNSIVYGSPVVSAELVSGLARFGDSRGDWRTAPPPPAQPSMPDPTVGLPG